MNNLDKIDVIFISLISVYLIVLFITICVLLHQNDIKKEKENIKRYKVIKVMHPRKKRIKKSEDSKITKNKTTKKKTPTKKKTNTKKKTTTKKGNK